MECTDDSSGERRAGVGWKAALAEMPRKSGRERGGRLFWAGSGVRYVFQRVLSD